jgi:hypothetical protein
VCGFKRIAQRVVKGMINSTGCTHGTVRTYDAQQGWGLIVVGKHTGLRSQD